jgi:hypothetical protein
MSPCRSTLSVPSRQQGLIKWADRFVSHGAAPIGIALWRLAIGKGFEGLPINIEYSQEIANPLVL